MKREELMNMYDFTGKTFAVTGGAGTLGSDVVVTLAGCGADVMILDLNLSRLSVIKESLGPRADQVDGLQADVLDRESLMEAGAAISERFGALYGLVNAAGGNNPRATVSADMSFFDIPEEGMRFVFDLNLLGTIMACQILGKQMVETGEGVILNYSSMNAFRPLTNIAAYSASKAGVTNFTAWLAVRMPTMGLPAAHQALNRSSWSPASFCRRMNTTITSASLSASIPGTLSPVFRSAWTIVHWQPYLSSRCFFSTGSDSCDSYSHAPDSMHTRRGCSAAAPTPERQQRQAIRPIQLRMDCAPR